MNCPKCNKELKTIKVKEVLLEVCSLCESVWLDEGELIKIVNIPKEELRNSELSSSLERDAGQGHKPDLKNLLCPKCGENMIEQIYCSDSKVKMDKCLTCHGIWLEDGEIIEVIDYINLNNKPLPEEKLKEVKARLQQVEAEWALMEKETVDSMVRGDEASGILGIPGKVLQALYYFFNKVGL